MEYMLMFYEPARQFEQRQDRAASQPYWAAWMAYVQAMHQSGIVKSGAGLQAPGPERRCASRRQAARQDGPFADTKEQLGGFFVIDVPDLDTALSGRRAPVRRDRRRRGAAGLAAPPQG